VDVHWNVPSTHNAARTASLRCDLPHPGTRGVQLARELSHRQPIPFHRAYPYTVYSDWYHYAPDNSMEVRFFVYPDHYEQAQEAYALTVP